VKPASAARQRLVYARLMGVRRATAEDWQALRELRLRALADSPDAFLATLAEAEQRSEDEWRDWGSGGVIFVDDAFDGMAGGFVTGEGDVMLWGMWVSPERRGSGLAEALARAVIEWARAERVPRVVLWVVIGNAPAERFYERLGFTPTGVTAQLRNGLDRELALALARAL
jgi:GNAT superfamily N-acetyltransferase